MLIRVRVAPAESGVEQLLSLGQSIDSLAQEGRSNYIHQSIVLDRYALELCPFGHPMRSASLIQLQGHLWRRYITLGMMIDLEEAIRYGRGALDLCPRGHHLRPNSLNGLALCLSTLHGRLGIMTDLDEAIVLGREALDLCPPGHPFRSTVLINVALCLSARHQRLGVMIDLHEAITLEQESLDLHPRGHCARPTSLNNLASDLFLRYEQLREVADLDKALLLAQEALDLCPQGHVDRSMSLDNLAVQLSTRHSQLRGVTVLEEAIELGRKALEVCPPPERSMRLNNLATRLFTRFMQHGAMADLYEAFTLNREALDLCPQGHPHRSISLNNLSRCFGVRFVLSGLPEHKEDLFNLFIELTNVPQIVSSSDLQAAESWVNVAEHLHHPTVLLAYETSLRLLVQHLATIPPLPQHLSILKSLTSSLAVDAFSACLRNHDPRKAVELLEQGRGVFWNQITRLCSPLEDVIASGAGGKTLADKFTLLTSLILHTINGPGRDQHDRLCHLNLDLQRVVTKIRELPGLARFLLPPQFSDLQYAAKGGPIIIVNASKYTCDALVVLIDRDPVHIPLQIVRDRVQYLAAELQSLTVRAKTMDIRRDLGCLLRELWDEVVLPVVNFLQAILPSQSRIWWCPTAEFSLLPLHAAGPYRKGQPNLAHLYISSYTPTLSTLIRARRPNPSDSAIQRPRFLAIGQANADGERELASVCTELNIVCQRVKHLAAFTRIEGPESCIERVSKELVKNEWVHLACHGLPNPKHPFESAFALHDGHFAIEHITRCELENAQFAYLSACHTTVGYEESPDEVIHLASAMQFAGFRSVIGTMWAVDDDQTNKITSMFYKHVMDESGRLDHTRAAFALNVTMNTLVDVPLDQRILYVHIGA